MPLSFTPGISEVIGTASQLSGALSDPVTATQVSGTLTASQGGTGLSSVPNGYVLVGNGTTTLTSVPYSNRLIAYATALALTASGDVALTMSNAGALGSYAVRRVTYGMGSAATLATILAVALVRTASGGTGSAITGALVFTGLSATTAYLDQVVTLASAVATSTALYVNVTTAAATAPASQIYIYADSLGA